MIVFSQANDDVTSLDTEHGDRSPVISSKNINVCLMLLKLQLFFCLPLPSASF